MQKIGVLTTLERTDIFKAAAGANECSFQTTSPQSVASMLAAWQKVGIGIAIIDDSAVIDKDEMETALLEWHSRAAIPPMRIIFVSDGTRSGIDPFFFQLVSLADIKDIVCTSINNVLPDDLAKKIQTPTLLAEVSFWHTSEKKYLHRAKKKRGPLGVFAAKKSKRDERFIQEAAAAAPTLEPPAPVPEAPTTLAYTAAQPQTEQLPTETKFCSRCGAKNTTTARFCSVCGNPLEQPEAPHLEPTPETNPSEPNEPSSVKIGDFAMSSHAETATTAGFSTGDIFSNAAEEPKPVENLTGADCTIAITAHKHGLGVTHLACALGIEQAAAGKKACVLISDRTTFNRFNQIFAVADEKGKDTFGCRGCTFSFWDAYSPEFDVTILDCGVADIGDENPGSPGALFRKASEKLFILSSAPWDLEDIETSVNKFTPQQLGEWTWMVFGGMPGLCHSLGSNLSKIAGTKITRVYPIPNRPDLFTSNTPQLLRYSAILQRLFPEIAKLKKIQKQKQG